MYVLRLLMRRLKKGKGIKLMSTNTAHTENSELEEITEPTEDMADMTNADICACCHHKNTPREEKEQKQLQNRINRIIGQLNGIRNMIEDNRYCGDVLIQIGAAESALQSLGYSILQEHLQTCVVEEIEKGNKEIMAEAFDLIRKLR